MQATTAGIDGQLFVFFIMVVAAAEVSVGLAIIVMMYQKCAFGGCKLLEQVEKLKVNVKWKDES